MYKMLVIEDQEDIRENIREIFELSGNEVFTAANGMEGIDLVLKHKPDIIICDIMMPVLDGFQFKKNLSLNSETASIPFIFLSAKADLDSIREGMDLGSDDYIVKPIRAKQLVDIVYKRMKRIEELKLRSGNLSAEKKLTLDEKIPVNTGKEHVFVSINSIVLINVKQDYSVLYLNNYKKIIIKKTIKSWEQSLPEKVFLRVHRSMILNTNYIEKIEPWSHGTLAAKVKDYPELVVFSKRYSDKIKKMIKNI